MNKLVNISVTTRQASVDMMLDNIIGTDKDTAIRRSDKFMRMIDGKITDDRDLEELDEAMYLRDVSHMPARVKCAVLGWRTLKEMLQEKRSIKIRQGP